MTELQMIKKYTEEALDADKGHDAFVLYETLERKDQLEVIKDAQNFFKEKSVAQKKGDIMIEYIHEALPKEKQDSFKKDFESQDYEGQKKMIKEAETFFMNRNKRDVHRKNVLLLDKFVKATMDVAEQIKYMITFQKSNTEYKRKCIGIAKNWQHKSAV